MPTNLQFNNLNCKMMQRLKKTAALASENEWYSLIYISLVFSTNQCFFLLGPKILPFKEISRDLRWPIYNFCSRCLIYCRITSILIYYEIPEFIGNLHRKYGIKFFKGRFMNPLQTYLLWWFNIFIYISLQKVTVDST